MVVRKQLRIREGRYAGDGQEWRSQTRGHDGRSRTARPDDPHKYFIVSADCHVDRAVGLADVADPHLVAAAAHPVFRARGSLPLATLGIRRRADDVGPRPLSGDVHLRPRHAPADSAPRLQCTVVPGGFPAEPGAGTPGSLHPPLRPAGDGCTAAGVERSPGRQGAGRPTEAGPARAPGGACRESTPRRPDAWGP
jgi:hypothetical protein